MSTVLSYLKTQWTSHQKLRFLVVGATNTLFGYGVFALLYVLLGQRLHYTFIQLMSHAVSVIYAFVGHRRLTFQSKAPWLKEFVRFNLSYLGSLGFGLLALPVLVQGFGISPLVGGFLVTTLTVILSYVFHRWFSFRQTTQSTH